MSSIPRSGNGHDHVPLVSVLLCVYNGGELLGEAVASVLDQSFKDLELVIVNDGSTDQAVEAIRKLEDHRIRIIDKENTGLTRSLNTGLHHCQGKYVARQDADDISCPDRLRVQVDFMESHPQVGALGSAVTLIDDDGDHIGALTFPGEHESIVDALDQSNQFVHGSIMFRRSAIESVRGYRETFVYAQDYDLVMRLGEVTRLANLKQALYCLRYGMSRISINHAAEQRGFANLARDCARQRSNGATDCIESGNFDGDLSTFMDEESLVDQTRVMLYLYSRTDHKQKLRQCINAVLKQKPAPAHWIKYQLIRWLTYLPGNLVRRVFRFVDSRGVGRR